MPDDDGSDDLSVRWPEETIRSRIRDWYGDPQAPLSPSFTSRAADADQARYREFARQVIAEIRRLDDEGPDWDIQLDKIRDSYGMG
jgi:hypothetical protein